MRWTTRTLAPLAIATALLAGCATTGPHGEKSLILIDGVTELRMGQETDKAIRKQYPAITDSTLIAYVDSVGQAVAAHSPRHDVEYRFTVLESDIVNAFAAPGGYVYVTTGLLKTAGDESELAGVLAHEVGHVAARHAIRSMQTMLGTQILTRLLLGETDKTVWHQVASLGAGLFNLKHSREHELEADRYGLKLAAEAGYDPEGLIRFLGRLKELSGGGEKGIKGWLSTHPATDDRLVAARQELDTLEAGGTTGVRHRERYLQMTRSLRESA